MSRNPYKTLQILGLDESDLDSLSRAQRVRLAVEVLDSSYDPGDLSQKKYTEARCALVRLLNERGCCSRRRHHQH